MALSSISDTKTVALLASLDNVACVLIKVEARRSNDRGSISGRQVCRSGDSVGNVVTKLCNVYFSSFVSLTVYTETCEEKFASVSSPIAGYVCKCTVTH